MLIPPTPPTSSSHLFHSRYFTLLTCCLFVRQSSLMWMRWERQPHRTHMHLDGGWTLSLPTGQQVRLDGWMACRANWVEFWVYWAWTAYSLCGMAQQQKRVHGFRPSCPARLASGQQVAWLAVRAERASVLICFGCTTVIYGKKSASQPGS